MKILVCVKVIKGELNPFDESALECALQLSKDVTVISMGPPSAKDVLLPLTRLGAKVKLSGESDVVSRIVAYGEDTNPQFTGTVKSVDIVNYVLVITVQPNDAGNTEKLIYDIADYD